LAARPGAQFLAYECFRIAGKALSFWERVWVLGWVEDWVEEEEDERDGMVPLCVSALFRREEGLRAGKGGNGYDGVLMWEW